MIWDVSTNENLRPWSESDGDIVRWNDNECMSTIEMLCYWFQLEVENDFGDSEVEL